MKKLIVIAILLISTLAFADQDTDSINKRLQYLRNQKALIQIKADAQKEYIDNEIKQLEQAKKQLETIKKKEEKKKSKGNYK